MHLGWILATGLALLGMAVLPRLLAHRPMSLPMIYVAFGYAAFELVPPLFGPQPIADELDGQVVLYFTEITVIVSLAVVGLSIERRMGLVSWSAVWRLLALTMPVFVLAAMFLGSQILLLSAPAALLLGAVLAPTDPVLAGDVQVSAPGKSHDRDEVRFTLTAEAGLNDSLAFPATHLAIAAAATSFGASWQEWALVDVLYRLVVGALVGWLIGQALTLFLRRFEVEVIRAGGVGVFVIGATLLTYGLTELVGGYGFLAVFIAALSRHPEVEDLREHLHGFGQQIESLLVAVALIGIGAMIAAGILDGVGTREVVVAVLLLLVVRPVAGALSLIGVAPPWRERIAISFLGIRGLGSLYYLAYATVHGTFALDALETVWATTVLVIVGSIVLHGVSSPWIMDRIDHIAGRDQQEPEPDLDGAQTGSGLV